MSRGKRYAKSELEKKKIMYIAGVCALAVLLVLIFTLSGYKTKEEAKQKIAELEEKESFDASLVSQSEDKNITEVTEENKANETEKIAINTSNATVTNTTSENTSIPAQQEEPVKKELKFIVPLEGEIYKDYSESTLIYSETLEEWTVHLGVDIKAEKGTPVIAAEDGTVESIKNDPRYGLTIILAHEDGFKTIYSNLQTAEFVQEGQTIEKGKTIASVGENASFEISEGAHLHFEMTKDGEKVNPTIYWNK
ncbi:MAG: M23 family metallopeptidase [Clostridia bacterium]|jgi:murein DD-endopeptidase MepM/ murein hydrolase activator NlpD|nr:M23 family metallopeptidase [Clostridia bacterium]